MVLIVLCTVFGKLGSCSRSTVLRLTSLRGTYPKPNARSLGLQHPAAMWICDNFFRRLCQWHLVWRKLCRSWKLGVNFLRARRGIPESPSADLSQGLISMLDLHLLQHGSESRPFAQTGKLNRVKKNWIQKVQTKHVLSHVDTLRWLLLFPHNMGMSENGVQTPNDS